jgi:hypothetical protein
MLCYPKESLHKKRGKYYSVLGQNLQYEGKFSFSIAKANKSENYSNYVEQELLLNHFLKIQ